MLRFLTTCTTLAVFAVSAYATPQATPHPARTPHVGVIERTIPSAQHGRAMAMTVWYPATRDSGSIQVFAENPVFHGQELEVNAELAPGSFPVVLMSHGMGGLARSLSWLATGLAERGAVVISVDHPNGSFGDVQATALMKHWTRPVDLIEALEATLKAPEFSGQLDQERLYATGFSYGGLTALSLGGLRADHTGAALYCAAGAAVSQFCQILKARGIDLRDLDADKWQASYKDPRIQAVAAIDPGLTFGISQKFADALTADTLLIGLGEGTDRLPVVDFGPNGSNLLARLPQAKVLDLAPATHFSAMPLCKPLGATLLAQEQDDPVCTDPAQANRALLHQVMIGAIAHHFGLSSHKDPAADM